MKTIVRKELRENLKWAVLAMLGFGLGLAYAWLPRINEESISSDPFLMITTFGNALIGIFFGLKQILGESRPDQWAFLVHRPVSRHTIFLGKAIAGMLLHLLATGIPFLIATIWASIPGHVAAPFDWRMTFPGIADILTGLVFYLAAVLTALRQARWYGSRALGIGAAIICALFVHGTNEFWQALIAIVVLGMILLGAAWGSFLTMGTYSPQPKWAKVGLGASLFLGILVFGSVVAWIAFAFFSTEAGYASTDYQVDQEGRILKVTQESGWFKDVVDLDGKPVSKSKSGEAFSYEDFLQFKPLLQNNPWQFPTSYRNTQRFFLPSIHNRANELLWYYVMKERRFQGYFSKNRNLAGYLGPEGFSPATGEKSGRFESLHRHDYWLSHVLRFPKKVYWVVTGNKQVRLLVAAPPGQKIDGACEANSSRRNSEDPHAAAVIIGNQIHMFKPEGDHLFTIPVAYDPKTYDIDVTTLPKGERFFFWYTPSRELDFEKRLRMPGYITEVAVDGRGVSTHVLPPLHGDRPNPSWRRDYGWFSLVPSIALVGYLGYVKIGDWLGEKDLGRQWRAVQKDWKKFLWIGLMMGLSGLLCSIVTLRIAKLYAFRGKERWGWAVVIFPLGPAGLLMFAAIQEWPARETCPSCQRKRVVARERCEHCDAEFPAPAEDGTEIFDLHRARDKFTGNEGQAC